MGNWREAKQRAWAVGWGAAGAPEEMEKKGRKAEGLPSFLQRYLLTCLHSWDGSFPHSVGPGSQWHRNRRRCQHFSHKYRHGGMALERGGYEGLHFLPIMWP